MRNIMKKYLGEEYTNNHICNFLNHWIKGQDAAVPYDPGNIGPYYEWRRANDLDCIAKDGDLRADTLISMWSPMKMVLQYLHPGMVIYKTANGSDPNYYLSMLRDNFDKYFKFEDKKRQGLVTMLDSLCAFAEKESNFILLPGVSRDKGTQMNPDRYGLKIHGKYVWLYDQVPCTLYHVFEKDTLGKYFNDEKEVIDWIKREHLEVGFNTFVGNNICQECIIPLKTSTMILTNCDDTDYKSFARGKWCEDESSLKGMLEYGIELLAQRASTMENAKVKTNHFGDI